MRKEVTSKMISQVMAELGRRSQAKPGRKPAGFAAMDKKLVKKLSARGVAARKRRRGKKAA